MLSFLRVVIVILMFSKANAATWNSDGTTTDIQSLHDSSASDGDTITIPSGTHTWSSTVNITKRITIQGLGVVTTDSDGRAFECGTKINDNQSGGNAFISVAVPSFSGLAFHLTGVQFQPGTRTTTVDGGAVNMSGRYDSRRIRVSYCVFTNLAVSAFLPQTVYGVIDHCRIRANRQVPVAYVKGQLALADGSNTWGDEPWGDDDNYGTDEFLYFEDNNMGTDLPGFHLTGIDGSFGCRYVVRYNTIRKSQLENHGVEAERDRGARCIEVYNNVFSGDDSGTRVGFHRGGSVLYHDNTISGYLGALAIIALLNDRTREPLAYPFGGSDGDNPWDVNHASSPFDTATVTTATAVEAANISFSIFATGESYSVNQYQGYTIAATSGKTVSSMSRSGSTVTVNTSTAHGFSTGDPVSIWGADQQGYNFRFLITVSDSDTFTFSTSFAVPTPATGTIRCRLGARFAEIISNTATKIIYNDSLFFDISPNTFHLQLGVGDTYEINKVTTSFGMIGLGKDSTVLSGDYPSIPGSFSQASSPCYECNNTREGGADVDFSNDSAGGPHWILVENTHFFQDTCKPGHTDYQYPHELVSGDIQGRGRSHKLKNIRLK